MYTSNFRQFPDFTKLTLADKSRYEAEIADFPPFSDISFATLMIWWNTLDSCAVAKLNDNLVISYWLPGDEAKSGLSLIGRNKVDESMCTILDYLEAEGKAQKLVHVPEFVLSAIKYPEYLLLLLNQSMTSVYCQYLASFLS